MTGEEMERAIDFLLKSQANLEARIEQVNTNLGARINETNRQLGELSGRVGELSSSVGELSSRVDEFAGMQTTFIEVVTRTFEAQAEINRRTDEKLNALIDAVNKMLGGKS